tara:strand:- start:996 stop:1457 length:462 start_codon:yes stop_codon:yes gene_type:complete
MTDDTLYSYSYGCGIPLTPAQQAEYRAAIKPTWRALSAAIDLADKLRKDTVKEARATRVSAMSDLAAARRAAIMDAWAASRGDPTPDAYDAARVKVINACAKTRRAIAAAYTATINNAERARWDDADFDALKAAHNDAEQASLAAIRQAADKE